jgi:hypothetical protein
MKVEELMIGDWVLYKGKPIKIIGTDGSQNIIYYYNEEDYTEYPIDASNIEPISLISEILEKNSFLKVETIEYPSHSVGISFLYRNTLEGLRIFVQNACVGGPTCTMIKTCKYVHEVQHMIKMCDIEKTFVL